MSQEKEGTQRIRVNKKIPSNSVNSPSSYPVKAVSLGTGRVGG